MHFRSNSRPWVKAVGSCGCSCIISYAKILGTPDLLVRGPATWPTTRYRAACTHRICMLSTRSELTFRRGYIRQRAAAKTTPYAFSGQAISLCTQDAPKVAALLICKAYSEGLSLHLEKHSGYGASSCTCTPVKDQQVYDGRSFCQRTTVDPGP